MVLCVFSCCFSIGKHRYPVGIYMSDKIVFPCYVVAINLGSLAWEIEAFRNMYLYNEGMDDDTIIENRSLTFNL